MLNSVLTRFLNGHGLLYRIAMFALVCRFVPLHNLLCVVIDVSPVSLCLPVIILNQSLLIGRQLDSTSLDPHVDIVIRLILDLYLVQLLINLLLKLVFVQDGDFSASSPLRVPPPVFIYVLLLLDVCDAFVPQIRVHEYPIST